MMKKIVPVCIVLVCLCACSPFIHGAVKTNDLERVKGYVAEGHVNDREGMFQHTPLIMAAYWGYTEIAEYLLENGADPNLQGIDGSTALKYAANYNYPDIVEMLLEHGALVNQKDKAGHTPLYYAEYNRYRYITEMLKAKGAVNQ